MSIDTYCTGEMLLVAVAIAINMHAIGATFWRRPFENTIFGYRQSPQIHENELPQSHVHKFYVLLFDVPRKKIADFDIKYT